MAINILQRFRRVFTPPGPAGVLTTPPIDHSEQLRNEIVALVPLIDALLEDCRSVVEEAEEQGRQVMEAAGAEAAVTLDRARSQAPTAPGEAFGGVRPDAERTALLEEARQEVEHIRGSAADRIEALAGTVARCVEETGVPE